MPREAIIRQLKGFAQSSRKLGAVSELLEEGLGSAEDYTSESWPYIGRAVLLVLYNTFNLPICERAMDCVSLMSIGEDGFFLSEIEAPADKKHAKKTFLEYVETLCNYLPKVVQNCGTVLPEREVGEDVNFERWGEELSKEQYLVRYCINFLRSVKIDEGRIAGISQEVCVKRLTPGLTVPSSPLPFTTVFKLPTPPPEDRLQRQSSAPAASSGGIKTQVGFVTG